MLLASLLLGRGWFNNVELYGRNRKGKMNRLVKILLCFLIGSIAAPMAISAASNEQLNLFSSLSNKDKRTLAKQACMDVGISRSEGGG